LASGNKDGLRKRKTYIPGCHLWLAATRTTYGFGTPAAGVVPVFDQCAPGSGGILRDDRDEIARKHWLSVAWYGPETAFGEDGAVKRNASWSLRCCPDIPSSADYDGGTCVYAQVGQVVRKLMANGQDNWLTPLSAPSSTTTKAASQHGPPTGRTWILNES
jgi:hypothetical protein